MWVHVQRFLVKLSVSHHKILKMAILLKRHEVEDDDNLSFFIVLIFSLFWSC